MSYLPYLAAATASRPSGRVGHVLDAFMLPGEPIVACAAGKVRGRSAWLVATPLAIVLVRDGTSTTVEGLMAAGELADCQVHRGRSKAEIVLTADRVTIRLDHVALDRADECGRQIDALQRSQVDGFTPAIAPFAANMNRAVDAVLEAGRAYAPETVVQAVVSDVLAVLSCAVADPAELTYDTCAAVWGLLEARPSGGTAGLSRSATLFTELGRTYVPSDHGYATVEMSRRVGDPGTWSQVFGAMAAALDAAVDLLPLESPTARPFVRGEVERFLRLAGDRATPVLRSAPTPVVGAPVSVMEQIERLHALRTSGALTDEEFVHLKQQALNG